MTEHVDWSNGEGLRKVRNAAGDTQRQAADKAGVSPNTINNLENGHTSAPQADVIDKLQEAYDVIFDGIEYKGRLAQQRQHERGT